MAGTRAQKDLVVRLRFENARFNQEVKNAERKINKLNGVNKKLSTGTKRSRDEFGKFSKTMKDTKKSTSLFSGALGGIGKKALSILGPLASITGALFLLKSAVSSIISAGRFAEDTITTLGVALGSERAGVEAFKKSLDFSVITPFDPRAVASATELAVAFGIREPFQKGVNGLADDVSLQQLAAGIASFSQDKDIVNAMKNILVPESEVIKRWGGEVMSIYRNVLERGRKEGFGLGSDEFQKAWLEGLSSIEKFQKAGEAASQTVTGLISTIGGNIANIALFFTGAAEGKDARSFWNFFRKVLVQVSVTFQAFMKRAGPFLTQIGAQVGGLFKDVFDIVVDFGKIVLTLLIPALTNIGVTLAVGFFILRGIVKVIKFVLDLTLRMVVATAKWATAGKSMKETFKDTGEFFKGVLDFANDTFAIFELILRRFSQAIDQFVKTIEVSGPFKAILDVLSKFIQIQAFLAVSGLKFIFGEDTFERAELSEGEKAQQSRRVPKLQLTPVSVGTDTKAVRGKAGRLSEERSRRIEAAGKTSVVVNLMPEQQEQLKNTLSPVAGRDVIFERDIVR